MQTIQVEGSVFEIEEGQKVIYVAGGCFWGTEHAFKGLRGVCGLCAGYANGNTDHPTYRAVCAGETGYKETVRLVYDPQVLSLETLMKAFFMIIDPRLKNRQGNDVGVQYQTGVYYYHPQDRGPLEKIFREKKEKTDPFYTELKPVKNFWPAEDFHQDYLEKFPGGYCHIPGWKVDEIARLV